MNIMVEYAPLLILIFSAGLFLKTRRTELLHFIGYLLLIIFGIYILKWLVHKCCMHIDFLRRPDSREIGMPSGHAIIAAYTCAIMSKVYPDYTPLLIVLALIVIVSRVVTGRHTLLQVCIGTLFGVGLAYL